jgi:exopolysaccharide biosynthesis WecB/TagA/CpsF family protein
MNGTDLIPKILASFHGRRVALWGTEEPHLDAAAKHCERNLGVRIVSQENGFHDIEFYRRLALTTQPELIVLGMGMPKQERVAHALRSVTGLSSLIVCGGAIIDFLGGKVRRAPIWMRLLGIEWAYRLAHEPKRLFKRYVVGNPLFLWRVQAWLMTNAKH